MKWSPEYKKAMDLVELWVLLKTWYDEHFYNGRPLIQLQRQLSHITPNLNEVEITTWIWSVYSGSKVLKNQAVALSIEYRTNLTDTLEEAGKVPAATHIRNIQRREYYFTLDTRIKYIKG